MMHCSHVPLLACFITHMWICHVTRHVCDMTHTHMSRTNIWLTHTYLTHIHLRITCDHVSHTFTYVCEWLHIWVGITFIHIHICMWVTAHLSSTYSLVQYYTYIWHTRICDSHRQDTLLACAMTHMMHYTHVNVPCHTCEYAVSHMKVSHVTHVWMRHVTHVGESCCTHVRESCYTCKCGVMATLVDESCHTCEWIICHMWMRHITHLGESCHTYECASHVKCVWVMSCMNESRHMWMSHVTRSQVMSHMNRSRHMWMRHVKCEWVMSHMNESRHVWMSHVSCHT